MHWWELLDEKLLRSHLRRGDSLLAGVSGGADSTAMLLSLAEARSEFGYVLYACYVDHGVRGAAGIREAEYVAELCSRLQIGFLSRRVPSLDQAPNLGSFEGKLRHLRYEAYASAAKEVGATWVAIGHTADDLVETFLMHLIRGMALRGACFHPIDLTPDFKIIRPLWSTSRSQVEEYLLDRGMTPLLDETNNDRQMLRNRVRHILLPLLKQWNPSVREALFRTAHSWGEAAELVSEVAEKLLREALDQGSLTPSSVATQPLIGHLHHLVRKEALALWLEKKFGKRVLTTHCDFARLESLLTLSSGHIVVLQGGIIVAKVGAELFACQLSGGVEGEQPSPQELAYALAKAFVLERSDVLAARLKQAHILSESPSSSPRHDARFHGVIFDICGKKVRVELTQTASADSLPRPFFLRNRRAGDRVSGKRLKELIGEVGVPFFLRDYLVLATDASDQILGAVGVPSLTADVLRRRQLVGAIELKHYPELSRE